MVYLIALLAIIVLAVGYYLSCRWWPYGPCLGCIGHQGRNRGSNSRRFGTCKRCKGSGKRIRIGARIWKTIKEGN